jgi:branched-chain amino acid transport system permease protein
MEFTIVSLLNGVVYGLLLFMVSAGLTLIFGMMGILNMAHASFYMIGAYTGYAVSWHYSFYLGLLLAPVVAGLIGLIMERYMLRSIHEYGHGHQLIFTFGFAFVVEQTVKLVFGDYPVAYHTPSELNFSAFKIFGTQFPFYRVLIALVSCLIFSAIFLLLAKTRVGLVVRAAERLPVMTSALGHDVGLVFSGVFTAGAAIAGLAGAIGGAYYPTSPTMALDFGTIVFVVVVVGGLGSVVGSLWASLLIGVLTSFVIGLDLSVGSIAGSLGFNALSQELSRSNSDFAISMLAGAVPFILMLAVLLFRPMGLMGRQ